MLCIALHWTDKNKLDLDAYVPISTGDDGSDILSYSVVVEASETDAFIR